MLYRIHLPTLLILMVLGNLAACAVTPAPSASHASSEKTVAVLTGTAHVYDGDSIFFGRVEVRLSAIDAPEKAQACKDGQGNYWPCGIAARDALRAMIAGGDVRCLIADCDKYRRLLGTCFVGGKNLNAAMVRSGNAIAYHYFSEKYAGQEAEAKSERAGIWQDAGFTEPFYCRHIEKGQTCYRYDFAAATGRVAQMPLTGRASPN